MGSKILVVDDDPEALSLVQYTLENVGHQVKICDKGREVLNTLCSYKPELLVLDIMLPDIDGYSLAVQIENDAVLKKIPIVVISALAHASTLFQNFSQVVAFITKPFNTDTLMEAVNAGLAKNTVKP